MKYLILVLMSFFMACTNDISNEQLMLNALHSENSEEKNEATLYFKNQGSASLKFLQESYKQKKSAIVKQIIFEIAVESLLNDITGRENVSQDILFEGQSFILDGIEVDMSNGVILIPVEYAAGHKETIIESLVSLKNGRTHESLLHSEVDSDYMRVAICLMLTRYKKIEDIQIHINQKFTRTEDHIKLQDGEDINNIEWFILNPIKIQDLVSLHGNAENSAIGSDINYNGYSIKKDTLIEEAHSVSFHFRKSIQTKAHISQ